MQRRRLVEVGVALSTGLGSVSRAWAQMPQVIRPDGPVLGSTGFGTAEARAQRGTNGHFFLVGYVNGGALQFVVDTGASDVALRVEDAAKAGIDTDRLVYSISARTANGTARYAPVVFETLRVGGITKRNVKGSISQPGALGINLLGQSFTGRVTEMRIEGDLLVLRD